MNIFFYNNDYKNSDEKIEQIWKILSNKAKKAHIVSIPKPDDFRKRIENFLSPSDIVVLICHDKEELEEILSVQNILKEARVIILSTQREAQMMDLVRALSPRFFGFLDNDFTEAKEIIERIIRERNKKFSHSDPLRYTNWGVRSIL